jgi:hypothetical protein
MAWKTVVFYYKDKGYHLEESISVKNSEHSLTGR